MKYVPPSQDFSLTDSIIEELRCSLSKEDNDLPMPTEEDINSPAFNAIWEVIKTWDVNVPEYYVGYSGATGSHVMLILNALRKLI